jgi:LmbE family N-acetylglucosaminyl deacetylase
MTTSFRLVAVVFLAALVSALAGAQMRVSPLSETNGHVALGLALRHLSNTGIFMHATAHPDDENNGLLAMLNRGQGFRTALATATRGNGGQNEIGPEIFEALGVLRTEELAAMHRFDGAEQYFTRAVDFGYSFSVEETFEKWGRDEITADYVRLIRTIRPDVILSLPPTGTGGGLHHQASAVIAREAFALAGDPSRHPEQIADGLRPWQPRKFYIPAGGFGGRGAAPGPAGRSISMNLATYDPLLGRTYAEIGVEARSMHKCQGMAQLLALPGPEVSTFQLVASTLPGGLDRADGSLFDGIDFSIEGLVQFAGPRPPRELVSALDGIAAAVRDAQRAFDTAGDEAVLRPLLVGLRAVRDARALAASLAIDEPGRFEIDFRLRQKEDEFQHAALLANGVRVEALAEDGVVVPGQPVEVSVLVANRGTADLTVKGIAIGGFGASATCALTPVTRPAGRGGAGRGAEPAAAPISTLGRDQVGRCEQTLTIPGEARPTEPYWHRDGEAGRYTFDVDAPFGLPYRPTPFSVQASMTFAGSTEEVTSQLPVEYRYQGNIFSGEKRSKLLVVPALSVRVSPEIAIVPAAGSAPQSDAGTADARPGAAPGRDIRVTVVNGTKGAIETAVRLTVPQGWTATPARQAVRFSREDEAQTVRFQLQAPSNRAPGEYRVGAEASVPSAASATFVRGYQVIEYPHITRQHIYRDAATRVKVIDVETAPDLRVGYVMGVGDEVPAAIAQLGVQVDLLGPEDLAWGDLSRYPTIVTGVRAYERRDDLRANNSRLLEYVHAGGTLIVQYNKYEFNDAQYGPYPAQVTADRVTDEFAPVRVLAPDDPVFTTPNRITDSAWRGWVQERGLYFLGGLDPRYRPLVEIEDSFPNNPGVKRGALVAAEYGQGRWVYVGLGLWRELPAGVDGAYQLLANLISLN